jgi:OOP family OmpA-OmpF porin
MSRLPRALLCAAVAILWSAPTSAQIAGHTIEVSGGAGLMHFDARDFAHDAPVFTGSLGWRAASWLTLEGRGSYASAKSDTGGEPKRSFLYAGLDLRFNVRPAESRAVPYVVTGFGYGKSHVEADQVFPSNSVARGAGTVGIGLLLAKTQRTYFQLEARDILFKGIESENFSNELGITASLHYVFGGKPKDQDLDGVRDDLDKCPNTPLGARVDVNGCPIDSDGDGVYDGLDKCPNTPHGCNVDVNGCPLDADGDGVCDSLDKCPGTPAGAKVDDRGCPIDSDGDGVYDGLDKCPGTLPGCTVDSTGCSTDSDGDGVCDGVDVCPNTPAGERVDEKGCPVEISPREKQLRDTGTIRVQNVQFNKTEIKPESYAVLDSIGRILQQYPTLRIEIGVHMDNTGTAAKNQSLSDDRAKAVLAYLKPHLPESVAGNISARGYGAGKPIAPNTTKLGRAKNRRIEFKVQNPDALRTERQKRPKR